MTPVMTSAEIRQKFLTFFEKRGHAILPSASLVPENDPSVLFNTAGMQPIVPYLLGAPHPKGKRLADVQKCVRTNDIEEVGDNRHLTFFEMLGNWSLGDYFKKDAINWSYELLTSKDEGFGLDANRLYVTCFEGDENAPKDEESAKIWQEIFEKNGIKGNRIFFMPAKNNWWSPGENGPCGPDSEMFYDPTGKHLEGLTHDQFVKMDDEGEILEIWNDVFMEYEKKDGKVIGKLKSQNVDTGSGLERITTVVQGKTTVFETDLFTPIIEKINELSTAGYELSRSKRIIADHIRSAVFLIGDGVIPSNTDQGYVLRRILRRAVMHADKLGMNPSSLFLIADVAIEKYQSTYPNLGQKKETIKMEIEKEEEKFRKTLEKGLLVLNKINFLDANTTSSSLHQTYGFPIELTLEYAKEKNIKTEENIEEKIKENYKKHQELSRVGAEQKFKGGLGGTDAKTIQYHTATHLLHQALREVLGTHVGQKGSNITTERLRFDFTHPQKMTDEEKKKVEDIVNEKISAKLPVNVVTLSKEEAEKTGALHFFGEKYPDEVTVYYIGDTIDQSFSKEFCGGPHVKNTSELGHFKIAKEEAVSQGVRRIKATLS
ncbi:MAG: alanine--tRNA ligase [Candidatus Paceibacterota bacterium]|jgi:alanyl-tRNA synthetase